MEDKAKVLFSVIVPVYNQCEYLPYCIETLKNQTFQGFEAILVNDGSTDGSAELCDIYAQNIPNIKVVHKKNEGVMYARRTGINIAEGKYILFLDSDDGYRYDSLEIIKKTIEGHNSDCVFFNASIHDDFSDSILDYRNIIENSAKNKILEVMCGTHTLNSIWSKCVARELFVDDDFDGYNMVTYGEDYFQLLPIIDRAEHISVINLPLYYYRQNQNSVTHKYNRKQVESLLYVMQRQLFYAKKWTSEYNNDYVSLLNFYVAQECYTIIKNISFSNMSFKDKVEEIDCFKETQIYRSYSKYVKQCLSFTRFVLFFLLTSSPNIIRRAVMKSYFKF